MPTKAISGNLLNINIIDLLVEVELVSSKSEARRLIEQNGISLNQNKVTDINKMITIEDFKNNNIILQKGKKIFLKVEIK